MEKIKKQDLYKVVYVNENDRDLAVDKYHEYAVKISKMILVFNNDPLNNMDVIDIKWLSYFHDKLTKYIIFRAREKKDIDDLDKLAFATVNEIIDDFIVNCESKVLNGFLGFVKYKLFIDKMARDGDCDE